MRVYVRLLSGGDGLAAGMWKKSHRRKDEKRADCEIFYRFNQNHAGECDV
jgi:hypothetical protein